MPGKYKIILDSDTKEFGGYERITKYTGFNNKLFFFYII